MDPAELANVVDRELGQLPAPRAPRTLLPRVLTAVDEWSRRPWYTRAWFTWPLAWQVVSLAALTIVVGGAALVIPNVQAASEPLAAMTATLMRNVVSTAHRVDTLLNAGGILWRAVFEPLAAYSLVLMLLMCVACAAFSTALNRLTIGRT